MLFSEVKMRRLKTIDELTISDDFMFGAVMKDPKLCKPLLEYILGIKIKEIKYPQRQKVIDERYDSKSVRLDVYVEDDENTVYNIEIQTTSNANLPKRMRYYQGIIDLHIISKGIDYDELKKSFVIFICTFDPFGKGRYIYTFENICKEDNTLTLNDEAIKVAVNVNGTVGNISDELKAVLKYIAGGIPESEYTKDLDTAVDNVKKDKEWGREYMTLYMRDMENQKIGKEIGEKIGKEIGKFVDKISLIRGKKDKFDEDTLADLYDIDKEKCRKIIFYIEEYPEMDDEEIAKVLFNIEE